MLLMFQIGYATISACVEFQYQIRTEMLGILRTIDQYLSLV